MKRVFIIHGWEADPDCNWFPWLKNELIKRGIEAEVPAMPNTLHPKCEEWVGHLWKIIGVPDKNTFLVGHSLGPIAILRYLESLDKGEKVGQVIMVAGFSEMLDQVYFEEVKTFFTVPLDYEKVKKAANKFIAINSDDDPYVALRHGEVLKEKLGAELIVVHAAGHLNTGDGYFELPIVLEKILAMAV